MSAASPGVVTLFFHNDYYKTHEEYLYAIADAMQYEYETIASVGLVLQLDCPDLGLGRHVQFPDLSIEEFRGKAQLHVEALNHAVRNMAKNGGIGMGRISRHEAYTLVAYERERRQSEAHRRPAGPWC